jgi:hypothetical protein
MSDHADGTAANWPLVGAAVRKLATFIMVAPLVVSLASSDSRAETTIEGIARSVSLFTAISVECSQVLKVDVEKANRYEQAFLEVGKKSFGSKQFLTVLKKENERRSKEVRITGRVQWCAYQQGFTQKIGSGEVFVSPEKGSLPADSKNSSADSKQQIGNWAIETKQEPITGRPWVIAQAAEADASGMWLQVRCESLSSGKNIPLLVIGLAGAGNGFRRDELFAGKLRIDGNEEQLEKLTVADSATSSIEKRPAVTGSKGGTIER